MFVTVVAVLFQEHGINCHAMHWHVCDCCGYIIPGASTAVPLFPAHVTGVASTIPGIVVFQEMGTLTG